MKKIHIISIYRFFNNITYINTTNIKKTFKKIIYIILIIVIIDIKNHIIKNLNTILN